MWRVPESHRWRLEVTPAKRKRVRFKVNVETDEVERDAFGMPIRVVVEIVDRAVVEQPRLRGGSRASVGSSASRLTHCGTMHDSRCVILGDNLAAVLCFARARSCDLRLCVQVSCGGTNHSQRQQQSRNWLVDLFATSFSGDFVDAVTDFERRVTSWEHEAKEILSDWVNIGAVIKGLEKYECRDHLLINTAEKFQGNCNCSSCGIC